MSDDTDDNVPPDGERTIRALVAAAEEVPDHLDGLVEKAKAEAGHPFRPEIIEALAHLRGVDRAGFETLRAQLKRTGVRVADLDVEIDELLHGAVGDNHDRALPISADLTRSLEALVLFRTPDGRAYADIEVNGHRETIALESKDFADRLTQQYFTANAEVPSSEELRGVISLARARAKYGGREHEVYVRVAENGGKYYLDLGDTHWRAVEITRDEWRIVTHPPVRFVRYPGYLALPEPRKGGSIDLLRKHVNLRDDDDFVLAVGWLLSALRPLGPYPVLAVNGEQGSAKSTLSHCLRALVDPNVASLRPLPKSEHDLMISATRAHVLAYDNISRISSEMSDALCRLSTGGGFATRSLYTDADETLLQARRPILLNGIDDVIARPDLAQRTITLELQPIAPSGYQPAELMEKDFEADRPFILGALLDAMVHGIRHLDDAIGMALPRMADAARWMVASEGALWLEGTVIAALKRNARTANDRLAERLPVVTSILELMREAERWEGTASQLLTRLNRLIDESTRRSNEWPKGAARLGHMLKNRLRPLLRELGIEISGGPTGHDRRRVIVLERITVSGAHSG
jgi:hypothetical protein